MICDTIAWPDRAAVGEPLMLTLEDCIALCDLTDEEIDAIAEHEHLPHAIALSLGNYLVHTREGRAAIRAMIRDDIAVARARGDFRRAGTLKLALARFIREHGMTGRDGAPGPRRLLV